METVPAGLPEASRGPVRWRKSAQGSAFWAPFAGSLESRCFPLGEIGPRGRWGWASGTLLQSVPGRQNVLWVAHTVALLSPRAPTPSQSTGPS